jgi:AraC-like DNA-binding protein
LLLGRNLEALAFFQNLPEEQDDLLKVGGCTLAHASLEHIELAQQGISTLESAMQSDLMDRAMNLLILCQTMMGKYDAAIKLIEQGIAYRLPMMVYLNVEPLLKPLHSMARFQELMHQILGKSTATEGDKRKYKKSLLHPNLLRHGRVDLMKLMATEQPYLNPELTLRDLASRFGIPANQLSQLLNEGFDQNFAEFVNTYRVEMFKSKAADPQLRNRTILALAYECGFNSKTVFNTFFKKIMGQTPGAYWKAVHPK